MKWLSVKCHITTLVTSQHSFRKWSGAIRQQAITQANSDPKLSCRFAKMGHSALNAWLIIRWLPCVQYLCTVISQSTLPQETFSMPVCSTQEYIIRVVVYWLISGPTLKQNHKRSLWGEEEFKWQNPISDGDSMKRRILMKTLQFKSKLSLAQHSCNIINEEIN